MGAYDTTTTATDDVTDNLSQYHNELQTAILHLMSSVPYAAYGTPASMTGNVTLVDGDFPLLSYSPTAARILTLPAVATTNHAFYIINRSATYDITVKNAGAATITTITAGTSALIISDGVNNWYAIGSSFSPFTGDSGSGGTSGAVPAPSAGDAAALKFLMADGTWATAVTPSGTQTLTNKRNTPRVVAVTVSATPAINVDNGDVFTITSQNAAITSMTTNLTGTPTSAQKMMVEILDDGTARAITWGASFASGPGTLPTTTTANKWLYAGFEYSSSRSKWICLATGSEQ